MTASLLLIVSGALLALISGFCFVGCVLDTHGTGTGEPPPDRPFTKYSDDDVLGNGSCVAYWPLDEASPVDGSGKITAHDAKGSNDGEYKHKGNASQLFPCPGFELSPGVNTAQASGFLSLGVESIVSGDAKQPGNDPKILTTGMQVEGAFVIVPANSEVSQLGTFTVEAWVRPEWDANEPPTKRFLIDSHNDAEGSGFVISVNESGNWQVSIGYGSSFLTFTGGSASLSTTSHVVLTFDGNNAAFFVNGVKTSQPASLPAGAIYTLNTTVALVIGVGLPYLPERTQPSDKSFFPLVPFRGTIQDVAVYSGVFADSDIMTHFNDGSGKTTVPAD